MNSLVRYIKRTSDSGNIRNELANVSPANIIEIALALFSFDTNFDAMIEPTPKKEP
ncbi:MAG: hypothetical protein PME_36410 [Priestia megaterium]